jgi:hypothetical protein
MKHIDHLIARGDELFRRETPESINEATLLYVIAAELLGQRPQALPANDQLWGYWNTIANRLCNIRNCRNIEGIDLQLPIFEPPIDPALLVRAAAAGIDIGTPISDSLAGVPRYLDQHERELEITTRVSLVLHDPHALMALKTTGHCEVELTESVFDADHFETISDVIIGLHYTARDGGDALRRAAREAVAALPRTGSSR